MNFNSVRLVVFIALLLPLVLLVQNFIGNNLGANPVEALSHETGRWALKCLLLSLTITPAVKISGYKKLILLRRMLGLYAFFYASIHMMIYAIFDQSLSPSLIIVDILERPYITLGFTAWLLMIPLAVTSTHNFRRRLGRRWLALHRIVYAVAAIALTHFLWKIRADFSVIYPYLLWALVLALFRLKPYLQVIFPVKKKPA